MTRSFPPWFLLLALALGGAGARATVFDVRSFGATGDGRTPDTAAINRAIDAASAAGGGTVYFPAGDYLSFSIHLRNRIALHLDAGATIVAAEPSADLATGYDAPEPNASNLYQDFGHTHWHNSLIWGEGLEDIAIYGPGKIYGRGLSRGSHRRDLTPEERRSGAKPDLALPPDSARDAIKPGPFQYPNARDTLPAGVGNKAIALKNCRNVIFRDFTVLHGGHFAILGTGVDNWTIDNLTIDTNRDGIDLDACVNVRVSNCAINAPDDDGLCLKSSYALGYARSTDNITITNCYVSGFVEGTLLDGTRQRARGVHGVPFGRIKLGTESNGGFRNITIANCVFEFGRGLALESVDGALLEDITVTNLAMRDIGNAPIFVRLGARLRGPDGTPPGTARRIKISHVVAHNVAAESGVLIAGLADHPIEDLALSHIFIDCAGGGTAAQGERLVPENEKAYPEPTQFGVMPAWGLWARHVRGFSVDHVEFRAATDDLRPTMILENVADVSLDHVRLPRSGGAPVLGLRRVTGLRLDHNPGLPDVGRSEPIEHERW